MAALSTPGWIAPRQFGGLGAADVLAAVVDEHDLEDLTLRPEHIRDAFDQRAQCVALVKEGHDNADQALGRVRVQQAGCDRSHRSARSVGERAFKWTHNRGPQALSRNSTKIGSSLLRHLLSLFRNREIIFV